MSIFLASMLICFTLYKLGFKIYYTYLWRLNKQKILPFSSKLHFLFFYLVYPGFTKVMLTKAQEHSTFS